MGWLGNSRTTTVQQNTTPQWVEGAVQEGLAAGRAAAGRNFVPYQQERVAGMDPMEAMARDAAMHQAGSWQPGLGAAGAAAAVGVMSAPRDVQGYQVAAPQVAAPRMAPVSTMQAAGPAQTQQAAATSAMPGITQYQNPFQEQVIDAATRQIRRQADIAQAQVGQRAAGAQALGGTREQILRAEVERSALEQTADTTARLAMQGWNSAADLAGRDADRGQQVGLFNAGALNAANEAAAGRSQQTRALNMDARNTQARERARMQLDASLANAGFGIDAQRATGEFGQRAAMANQGADAATADRALRAGGLFGDLASLRSRLGLADVATLQGLGAEGRAINQQRLDADYGEFMRGQEWADDRTRMLLASIYGAPFNLWSSSTNTSRTSNPAAGLQAAGSFLQGMGGLFGGGGR